MRYLGIILLIGVFKMTSAWSTANKPHFASIVSVPQAIDICQRCTEAVIRMKKDAIEKMVRCPHIQNHYAMLSARYKYTEDRCKMLQERRKMALEEAAPSEEEIVRMCSEIDALDYKIWRIQTVRHNIENTISCIIDECKKLQNDHRVLEILCRKFKGLKKRLEKSQNKYSESGIGVDYLHQIYDEDTMPIKMHLNDIEGDFQHWQKKAEIFDEDIDATNANLKEFHVPFEQKEIAPPCPSVKACRVFPETSESL